MVFTLKNGINDLALMLATLTCIDAFYQHNVEDWFTCSIVVESTKIPLTFLLKSLYSN